MTGSRNAKEAGWVMRLYGWTFALTVGVPLVLASAGVSLLSYDLVSQVSTGANQADNDRSREVVHSAFAAAKAQMRQTVLDNAFRDDAARNVYPQTSSKWVAKTWAVGTYEAGIYDAFLIVEGSLGYAVEGYLKGKPFLPDTSTYFKGLDVLLGGLSTDTSRTQAAASVMEVPGGLALVAASPILPTSKDIPVPQEKRYLVLIEYLDASFVENLGDEYVLDNLRLEPLSSTFDGYLVSGVYGAPVAKAVWDERRPGDQARSLAMNKAFAAVGLLLLVMAGIAALCWRLVRSLAEREDSARKDANHDALTGILNRPGLLTTCGGPSALPHAVVFIDLDGFKHVNDSYGHSAGDELIRIVAAGFAELSGKQALAGLARVGGDEFAAVFSGASALEDARAFADDVLAFVATPFNLNGRKAPIGASIGIASSDGTLGFQELLRRADVAMYRSKENGKKRITEYVSDLDKETSENWDIAEELRAIIREGAIEVRYQPIMCARSNRMVGVEALARWPSSSPRQVGTERFIAVAEQNGLIDDLGDIVLSKACHDGLAWPDLKIAVNISPVQLKNEKLVERTLATISASGIDVRRVELEITENALLDDVQRANAVFKQFRENGLSIALDDFGAGFSSISYLKLFSFDRIKIDRSLVDAMETDSTKRSLIQGTMVIADGLSMVVTAEGVETAAQRRLLSMLGCGNLQGYFFHRPLERSAISALINRPRKQSSVA
ncbi:bifunctional diguanylate cyclase/phosphodiesterase [Hyphomicrobium sp.]|uniref:bifunctional diguanylate cyclase/phosphodiesterase n=1 Tax=Hyphomicrobium sp. TaxID=82 RepID=UPI002FE0E2B1